MLKNLKPAVLLMLSIATYTGCASFPWKTRTPPTLLTNQEIDGAVFTPDGKTIVFALASSNQKSRLFKINSDGTGLTPITSGDTYDATPNISPDGKKIVYFQGAGGNGDIYTINLDGSNKYQITGGPENDWDPVWSADSSKIYFLRASFFGHYSPIAQPRWHNIYIFSVNSDRSELKQLTKERYGWLNSLSFNIKTNSLVACTSDDQGKKFITIPIAQPENTTAVRPNLEKFRKPLLLWREPIEQGGIIQPSVSPDGVHVAFVYKDDIYVINLMTEVIEKVWEWGFSDKYQWGRMNPKFSNDGQRIVFETLIEKDDFLKKKREPELWVININEPQPNPKSRKPILSSDILRTMTAPIK
jgi:Tol biopolymer transport system component